MLSGKALESFFYIALGWILGFFGTRLERLLDRKNLKNDFKKALCTELSEIIPRFVGAYYLLNSTLGNINREVLNWIHSMNSVYPGELPEAAIKHIENLLKMNDEQLKELSNASKEPESVATSVPIYKLPFLEENFPSLPLLDSSTKNYIISLRRNLSWINQEIERCNFYFEKSFDESIGQANRTIMKANTKKHYERIANLSRKSADLALKIIAILENKSFWTIMQVKG